MDLEGVGEKEEKGVVVRHPDGSSQEGAMLDGLN